jgi:hypothetical protein
MHVIHYIPTGKNRWDIRFDGGKKGRIQKERGRFVAVLTRSVPNIVKDGVCAWLETLNG